MKKEGRREKRRVKGRVQHAKEEERGIGEGRGTERKEKMLSNLTRSPLIEKSHPSFRSMIFSIL